MEQGRFDELDKGDGRIEQRCHVRLDVTGWLESARGREGLAGVVDVTRRVHVGDREREEHSCYITSLQEETSQLASRIRRHWHIEKNGQHRVLDVIWREGDSRSGREMRRRTWRFSGVSCSISPGCHR